MSTLGELVAAKVAENAREDTKKAILAHFEEALECARLLGVTNAKRGFGCYTEQDSRFERAMHESIAHIVKLLELKL